MEHPKLFVMKLFFFDERDELVLGATGVVGGSGHREIGLTNYLFLFFFVGVVLQTVLLVRRNAELKNGNKIANIPNNLLVQ